MVIYRHKERYPISVMCQFFGVCRSGYYGFCKRIGDPEPDAELAELLQSQQERCRQTYGYRRMWLWLEKQGIHHNPQTVLRVMKKYNILAEIRRPRKWVQMGLQMHKYENLLNRDFHADAPNQKWVTDISYIHTDEGVIYLSMIRDLYDNSIVAYKTAVQQTVSLVLDTIRLAMKAEKKRAAAELHLHSDLLFLLFYRQADGIQDQIYGLGFCRFISYNTVIIKVANHGQIEDSLACVYVGDICDPFGIWPVCMEIPVEQVFIPMNLLPHIDPLPGAANFC